MYLTIVSAARFLVEHSDEPVTLHDLADHVGYSPFHVARSFERYVGMPPGQFLAAHRFQRAKQMLLAGEDKVIDICNAVGFSSVGTFTTRFVKVVGLSPTDFRRLPHTLADRQPRPVSVRGPQTDGTVITGAVHLSPAARTSVGPSPAVYVGLFRRRAAHGVPVAGTLMGPEGYFILMDVPPGAFWLLVSVLASRTDAPGQLVPVTQVVGAASRPVLVPERPVSLARDVSVDVAPDWFAPVLVALPPLAAV